MCILKILFLCFVHSLFSFPWIISLSHNFCNVWVFGLFEQETKDCLNRKPCLRKDFSEANKILCLCWRIRIVTSKYFQASWVTECMSLKNIGTLWLNPDLYTCVIIFHNICWSYFSSPFGMLPSSNKLSMYIRICLCICISLYTYICVSYRLHKIVHSILGE